MDKPKPNPDVAANMAVNAVLKYLRESGIVSPDERRAWVEKVFDLVRARETQVN